MNSIEKEHVFDVYNSISEHFSDTRFCIWNFVKNFLDSLPADANGIDIGCGNGKNALYRKDIKIIGYDSCSNFVNICIKKGIKAFEANCLDIPSKDNSVDFAMSIAVYHHLSTDEHRIRAINEMIRCLKVGGKGLFSVWSVENQESEKIKRSFKVGDNYVKWMRKKDSKIFQRYYYVFNEKLINELMSHFNNSIKNLEIFNERGNWVVSFIKS